MREFNFEKKLEQDPEKHLRWRRKVRSFLMQSLLLILKRKRMHRERFKGSIPTIAG